MSDMAHKAREEDQLVYASIPEAALLFLLPGLLQGLAFWYLTRDLDDNPSTLTIALMMAVLTVPIAHFLTTTKTNRLAALIYAAGLGAVIAGLYLMVEGFFGNGGEVSEEILGVSVICNFLIAYISAPFFRTMIERRLPPNDYKSLFEYAWNLPVIGAAAVCFTIVLWIVLYLWAALFDLIGIDFFQEIFGKTYVAMPLTMGGSAVAIGIVREREGIVLALRSVLFALLKVLSPVLALATALFAVAALTQGMDELWDNWSATSVMVAAITLAVIFSNAAVGEKGNPTPALMGLVVRVQAVVMPVLAAFAVYGLWLRIDEYGLTVPRVYAAIIVAFATAYALAYCVGALIPKGWGTLRQANIGLAVAMFAVAVLLQTPLANLWQWVANDQVARLKDGDVTPREFDFAYLRFDLGQPGERALERIAADESLPEHDYILERIEQVRAADNRRNLSGPDHLVMSDLERAFADGAVESWPEGLTLPETLFSLLAEQDYFVGSCLRGEAERCVIIRTEAMASPREQYLLLRQGSKRVVTVVLFVHQGEEWVGRTEEALRFSSADEAAAFMQAAAAGDVSPGTVTYRTLLIGEEEVRFIYVDDTEERLFRIPAEEEGASTAE